MTAEDLRAVIREEVSTVIREEVSPRLDRLEGRTDGLKGKIDRLDRKIDQLDRKLTKRFDDLEANLVGVIDDRFPLIDTDARRAG